MSASASGGTTIHINELLIVSLLILATASMAVSEQQFTVKGVLRDPAGRTVEDHPQLDFCPGFWRTSIPKLLLARCVAPRRQSSGFSVQ